MKEIRFRTNINCESCIKAVSSHLNSDERIVEWSVDIHTPARELTVVAGDDLQPAEVEKLVSDAGFEAVAVAR